MVYVTLNGVTSLNLTISQPRESAECVQNYITTVTSIGLTGPLVSMVNASDSTPAFDTITNLSMCEYNYTVNVVAVDLAGNWSQPFVSMARITLEGKVIIYGKNVTVIHKCETCFAKNKTPKLLFFSSRGMYLHVLQFAIKSSGSMSLVMSNCFSCLNKACIGFLIS